MASLSNWLAKLCSPGSPLHAWTTTPFHVTTESGSWTIATNSKTVVALAGLLPGHEPCSAQVESYVGPYLRLVTEWQETVPFGLLRRWCGQPKYPRRRGRGVSYPDPKPGELLGAFLDRNLLACAVEQLEGDTVRVGWTRPQPLVPLIFEPEPSTTTGQVPWRVVIMPMALTSADEGQAELFGTGEIEPSVLAWNDGTVRRLAHAIAREEALDRLPILADALEEAGCESADILAHCRRSGHHGRSCWLIDLILGKG